MKIRILLASFFLIFLGVSDAYSSINTPHRTIQKAPNLEKRKNEKIFSFVEKIKKVMKYKPFTRKENIIYGTILLVLASLFFGYGGSFIFASFIVSSKLFIILGICAIGCSIYFLVKGIKLLKAAKKMKNE